MEHTRSRKQWKIPHSHGLGNIYVRASVQPIEDPTSIDQVENETSSVACNRESHLHYHRHYQSRYVLLQLAVISFAQKKLPVGYNEISGLSPGMYIVILSDGTRCKAIVR